MRARAPPTARELLRHHENDARRSWQNDARRRGPGRRRDARVRTTRTRAPHPPSAFFAVGADARARRRSHRELRRRLMKHASSRETPRRFDRDRKRASASSSRRRAGARWTARHAGVGRRPNRRSATSRTVLDGVEDAPTPLDHHRRRGDRSRRRCARCVEPSSRASAAAPENAGE